MFASLLGRVRGTSGSFNAFHSSRSFRIRRISAKCVFAIALFPALVSPLCAGAGGTVSGTVTDPSGAVVPEAKVVLHARDASLRRAALTDANGSYRFEAVAPGTYLLEADAPDFAKAPAKPLEVRGDSALELDIQLELARLQTEVVVTPSTTPLRAEEVSKALDTVGNHEMEARGEFWLPEALRGIPGLRVRQRRGPGGNAAIHIRGLRSADTAVLVDGFRFRDATDIEGSVNPFLQDLMVVNTERVEVLRGSGSSLYGSNATGGVINIVSDQGGGRPRGNLTAEGGGLGLLRGMARFSGGAAGQRLRYSGGVSHLNVRKGIDGFDAYRNSSGHGSIHYGLSPAASLSGRVFAADSFLMLNDSPFVPPEAAANLPTSGPIDAVALPLDQQRRLEAGQPFTVGNATFVADPNDPDNRRSSSFFAGALTFSQRLNRNFSYRAAYQGVNTGRGFHDGPGGIQFEPEFNNASRFDGRIDTAQARADWESGPRHLLSFGYEWERESYDNPSSDENPDPSQRVNTRIEIGQRSHAVYFQEQLRWLDSRFQVSVSGRAQSFNLSEPVFSGGNSPYAGIAFDSPQAAYTGDGSISYHFAETGTKIRAHAGNAYRAPSLFQRFGSSFFFGFFSPFGDPRLRPDRTAAFDTGLDQWLAGGRVRVSGTYFYTRLQEVVVFDFSGAIDPATDPFGRFGGYRNTGGGLARGAEFSVASSPTRGLDLTASYTYTNSDQRISTVAGGDFFRSFGISDHMFAMTAIQRIGRQVDVAFDLFAASEVPSPFFTDLGARAFLFDGPVKADLVVSYTLPLSDRKELRIHGKVENLFDRGYFEDGFRAPGVWATVGLGFRF